MRKVDIEVVDDFISPSYLEAIQIATRPASCPWYFQGSQSLTNYGDERIEDFGFSVGLLPPWSPDKWDETPLSYLIRGIVLQIKDYAEADHILRCRLDMTLHHSPPYIHPPHIDVAEKHVASIIYVDNKTDGDTVIYDHQQEWAESYPTDMKVKQRIAPKPGRMLLFDGSYVHTGYSPSENQTRILINTVLS